MSKDLIEKLRRFAKSNRVRGYFDDAQAMEDAADAIERGAAQGVRVKQLEWKGPFKPGENGSHYDHIYADSALGRYAFEWKSWKSYDSPTSADCPGDFFYAANDLNDAKAAAQADYEQRIMSALDTATPPAPAPDAGEELQARVQPWMMACFGPEISADKLERSDRFIEEALELVQAVGYSRDRVLALVDYVYGREPGEPFQEVGGVMITLAAFCLAHGMDMHEAGEAELARIWTKVEKIRAKQAAKPTGLALPIPTPQPPAVEAEAVGEQFVEQIAIKLHYQTSDDNDVRWGKQPSKYRQQVRSQVRDVLNALGGINTSNIIRDLEAALKAKTDEIERLTKKLAVTRQEADCMREQSIENSRRDNAAEASNKALREIVPNLDHVISWLENGCDRQAAAQELRIYQSRARTLLSETGGE